MGVLVLFLFSGRSLSRFSSSVSAFLVSEGLLAGQRACLGYFVCLGLGFIQSK
jgi:hypothetical protein